MLINLVLLLGTFTGTIGLQWTSSVTFPNGTQVYTCLGGIATFPWSFSLSSSEQVIDIEWYHVSQNRETLLAVYVSHNFLPYGDSEPRLSMVGNAGLQLTGVTLSDIGQFSIRVNLNGGQNSSQTAFLQEPEAPVTVSGNLRASILSTTQFPAINGESHLQLGCGIFTSLGQPPISVTWRTPSGHILSSTYNNGVFALTLPNPLEGGNYTCQLNGVPTGQSCLQNNPLFHTMSTVYVDDVTWSLLLLRNDMELMREENARLTEENARQTDEIARLTEALFAVRPNSCLNVKEYDDDNLVHTIYPNGVHPVKVYCDQITDNGGWTVIQRRQGGSVDFYRNWTEYESGFGNPEFEYWIGLANLHVMTSGKTAILRVDLMDFNGNTAYATYNTFNISGPEDNYRLTIGSYHGTAGDSLQSHNNMQFSTYDKDHDLNTRGNCAANNHGAWWYNACSASNLNGRYYSSGLANLHVMTNGKTAILRVDLMDFNGTTANATYNTFSVSGPEDNYRLTIGGYNGTAGDSLQIDNNMQFSTYDRDHDMYTSLNCAVRMHGGWWYMYCGFSNLNGRYYSSGVDIDDSIWWYDWHDGLQSLKRVETKIRI